MRNDMTIRKLSFGNGTITIESMDIVGPFAKRAATYEQMVRNNMGVTGRWEIIEVERLDLNGIANAISKLLKGTSVECESVLMGGIKFYKGLSEEQILQIITNNKNCIEKNIGFEIT